MANSLPPEQISVASAAAAGVKAPRPPVWPVAIAILVLLATISALLFVSLKRTGGRLVYALDDPYIHMAMAKNVAVARVWGVTSHGFTSSSSSLAWTGLLGLLFSVFGVHETIPFLVNVLAASLAIVVAYTLLLRACPRIRSGWLCATLIVFVFAAPLPALVFAGQEHIVHVICTLVFIFKAADVVSAPRGTGLSRQFGQLAALSFLLPLVRYEGLYPVALVSLLLLLRRRPVQAAGIALAGIMPVAAYAAISVSHGWWWAPNSVLLKANLPDWRTASGIRDALGYSGYSSMLGLPSVAFLVYAGLVMYAARVSMGVWSRIPLALALFVAVALIHLQYSQPRAFWLFRYEAYVVAVGIIVIAAALFVPTGTFAPEDSLGRRATLRVIGAVLLLLSPLTDRSLRAVTIVPQATWNIYQQQYQMGRFLREYYSGAAVALNDIGAASYLGDLDVVDMVGLASLDVARLRRAGEYTSGDLEQVTRDHGVRIAIVYDRWFPGNLPSGWLKAGSWKIRHAVVVGSDTVSFYASGPNEYAALVDHLREFQSALPAGVMSTIAN